MTPGGEFNFFETPRPMFALWPINHLLALKGVYTAKKEKKTFIPNVKTKPYPTPKKVINSILSIVPSFIFAYMLNYLYPI